MEHVGATMGIQIPLMVIARECLGHVCMIPEPIGSTHLRFDDTRVIGNCYTRLPKVVGLSDEILDVTRSFGMVRR